MSLLVTQESTMLVPEMLIPEFDDSGINGFATSERLVPLTLADPPNLCKQTCNIQDPLMTPGFIKLQRAAEELFDNDIDSYLLLTQIAFRALRQNSKYNKHKLLPNQALVGDYKSCHLTEQRYRDAKERIEHRYRLATFKGTNKGTIATLLNTDIYDINADSEERAKERTENEQRTTKEECKNKSSSKTENTRIHSYSLSAVELLSFFDSKAKELWNPLAKPRPAKDAAYFEKLLQVADVETIKKVIIFAFTDEFWKGKIQTPKKLVEGSQDNPDRFAILLHKINTIKGNHERYEKRPTESPEPTKRRANELVV